MMGAPDPEGRRGRLGVTALLFVVALALRLYHLAELQGTPFEDERELISDSRYYDMRATDILPIVKLLLQPLRLISMSSSKRSSLSGFESFPCSFRLVTKLDFVHSSCAPTRRRIADCQ